MRYTPEQLDAVRLNEEALTLYWFDEQAQAWTPLPTTVDMAQQTASARVDHFTPFKLSDDSPASSAYIPSVSNWQVSQFTGAATFSYPIEVPAGPAGLRPNLTLSYQSNQMDRSTKYRQAPWVGLGWDLTTSYIGLSKMSGPSTNYFSLVLNGTSTNLVRGGLLPGGLNDVNDKEHWYWHATDENFMRVRFIRQAGAPYYGGDWHVWDRAGTRYEFSERALWGWNGSGCGSHTYEYYKWMLKRVVDVHGNQITYNYGRAQHSTSCGVTVDVDIYPTEILWGWNPNVAGSSSRHRVVFHSSPRGSGSGQDMAWDAAENQLGGAAAAPHETRRLDDITVWSKPDSTWELVRRYELNYDFSLYSDAYLCSVSCDDISGTGFTADSSYRKLTLLQIRQIGRDDTTALPWLNFTYHTTRGVYKRANGGWNRLATANNSMGGTVTFAYENISQWVLNAGLGNHNEFFDRHRVISRTVSSGLGATSLTTYGYERPMKNSLGTANNGGTGPLSAPNSAPLAYAWKLNVLSSLAVPNQREFRGHRVVTETVHNGSVVTDPVLQRIRTEFIQGEFLISGTPCTPTVVNESDACFVGLRARDVLKGRTEKTTWLSAAGQPLRIVIPSYALASPGLPIVVPGGGLIDYTDQPNRGLWRSYVFESQTEEQTFAGSGGGTPKTKRTVTTIDTTCQNPNYGNPCTIAEYDASNTLIRTTKRWYAIRNDSTDYIVDRQYQELITDGANNLRAISNQFYDGTTTPGTTPTLGRLTRSTRYTNVPLAASTTNITLLGVDQVFGYDTSGNRTSETTYTGMSTRLFNGSTTT